MKTLMILSLAAAVVALPFRSQAWVAYHGGWGHCCYHAGYSCGGVSTGTAVAAGIAGLATGALIGSSIARANTPTYVAAPVYPAYPAYPAPYYAAPPVVVMPGAPLGSIYYSLPPGAQSANINGVQYYVLGSTFYRPYFGSNGVYYEVVSNPV